MEISKRKKTTTDTTLPCLFHDIILFQILPKLPVKSIFRFNCVSKHWHKTIQDVGEDFLTGIETGGANGGEVHGITQLGALLGFLDQATDPTKSNFLDPHVYCALSHNVDKLNIEERSPTKFKDRVLCAYNAEKYYAKTNFNDGVKYVKQLVISKTKYLEKEKVTFFSRYTHIVGDKFLERRVYKFIQSKFVIIHYRVLSKDQAPTALLQMCAFLESVGLVSKVQTQNALVHPGNVLSHCQIASLHGQNVALHSQTAALHSQTATLHILNAELQSLDATLQSQCATLASSLQSINEKLTYLQEQIFGRSRRAEG